MLHDKVLLLTVGTSLTPHVKDVAREAVRTIVRLAGSAMEYYRLPPDRVVELGSQVEI